MGTCDDDQVTIVRGANTWVMARTDRDAASLDDVLQTAGAFLSRALGDASPMGQRSIFEALQSPKGDEARFVIGAARPVTVTAFQADSSEDAIARQPFPQGRLLGRYTDCEVLRTVEAQAPWFVTAQFDWRGPDTRTDWPRRKVNLLGFPTDSDQQLDWLLLAATSQGKARQSDTSLLAEVGDETKKQITRAARKLSGTIKVVGLATALGAGIYAATALAQYARRKRRKAA